MSAPPADLERTGYWLAFNRVAGIGPARLASLLALCDGRIDLAWRAPVQTLREARIDRATIESLLDQRRSLDPLKEVERLQRAGVGVYTWDDPQYPASLRSIERPPVVLFVRGELLPEDAPAVAIVGTRHASSYGREVAHSVASELAARGVTIVSGLALGIDTVAHRAALEAGGRTLAVLGSGVDQLYPQQNRGLGEQITRSGAVLSEYPLGAKPEARNFPPRNRIISGLSQSVVIVEAGERSGALITAEYAAEQGRDLFAVPGSILNQNSAGCNRLISDGATPLLSVDDLVQQLNLARVEVQRSARAAIKAEPQEAALLAHLDAEPKHIDAIVRDAGLPSATVTGLLAVLELKGMVRQPSPMRYVRVR